MYTGDVYDHDVVLIMSKAEYDQVEDEYNIIRAEQRTPKYRYRKWFKTNMKWVCCCI